MRPPLGAFRRRNKKEIDMTQHPDKQTRPAISPVNAAEANDASSPTRRPKEYPLQVSRLFPHFSR